MPCPRRPPTPCSYVAQVAKCLQAAGRLDESIAMYENSRDMFMRLTPRSKGRDAVDVATVSGNLASVFRTKGLLLEAQVRDLGYPWKWRT